MDHLSEMSALTYTIPQQRPYWRTETAKEPEELDESTRKHSHRFILDGVDEDDDDENEAAAESDGEANEDEETTARLTLRQHLTSVQRAKELMDLQERLSDERVVGKKRDDDELLASVIFSTARQDITSLASKQPGDWQLHAITDDVLIKLILDVFVTGPLINGNVSDNDDDDDDENEAGDERWDVYGVASRVSDVIEAVNATRAMRPKMGLKPFNLLDALTVLPDDQQTTAMCIQDVMENLWCASEDEDEDLLASDQDSDETADVESIVADRETNGQREYEVQWEGFDDSFNAWLTLEELADYPQLLYEYHSLFDEIPIEVREFIQRQRSRKRQRAVIDSDDDE